MPRYRDALPQLSGGLYLTDGGLETTLVFEDGLDLPEFAAFPLLAYEEGRERFRAYYRQYAAVAAENGAGFVLESMTWRANASYGARLGFPSAQLAEFNREAIALLAGVRTELEGHIESVVISGCMGPAGDGYNADEALSADEAEEFHAAQVATFEGTEADMVTAYTMSHTSEAIGLARAADTVGMPCAIGFTVETDGRLPSGEGLGAAIEAVDAATGGTPAYYMINCAHPTHFAGVLDGGGWTGRIGALRANASTKSHEELDASTELDAGDAARLAREYAQLMPALPNLSVLGGCCGTDHDHVAAIAQAVKR